MLLQGEYAMCQTVCPKLMLMAYVIITACSNCSVIKYPTQPATWTYKIACGCRNLWYHEILAVTVAHEYSSLVGLRTCVLM